MGMYKETKNTLIELEDRKKSIIIELSRCPEGRLLQYVRNGHPEYFHVIQRGDILERRGITRQPDIASKLARKEYLKVELRIIEKNIATLSRMLEIYEKNYILPIPDNILIRLPSSAKHFPEQWLFLRLQETNSFSRQGKALKAQSENGAIENESFSNGVNCLCGQADDAVPWDKMSYEKGTTHPERLVHTTTRGLKLRSKSEVMIAEKLYEHGVPFRYEEVLHVGDKIMVPDFTIMTPDGRLVYWEHCGLTGNATYMERHHQKMNLYERCGIVPWKNLIVTYDDEDGNINMAMIDSTIRNQLL